MKTKHNFEVNQIVNKWKVIGELPRKKYRRVFRIECTNCEFIREVSIQYLSNIQKRNRVCLNCYLFPKGESGFNSLFLTYKISARDKNLEFSIEKDQFRLLTSGHCFYCGSHPSVKKGTDSWRRQREENWGDYIFNGVDRRDNSKGYILDNCVTCCPICNRAKNAMTVVDYESYLDRLVKFRVNKGN